MQGMIQSVRQGLSSADSKRFSSPSTPPRFASILHNTAPFPRAGSGSTLRSHQLVVRNAAKDRANSAKRASEPVVSNYDNRHYQIGNSSKPVVSNYDTTAEFMQFMKESQRNEGKNWMMLMALMACGLVYTNVQVCIHTIRVRELAYLCFNLSYLSQGQA
jgi:hypothetical protein